MPLRMLEYTKEEIYGRTLEKTILSFMKHSLFYQVVRNGKHGPQIYGFTVL